MRERKFPTVIKTLNQVVALSTGSLHNAALTSSGLVYTWGCNDDGALGRDGDEWAPNPVNLHSALKVCCGSSHTLALTSQGLVYSWGTYRNGQGVMGVIGDDPEKKAGGEDQDTEAKVSRPTEVEDLGEVIDIACGDSISVALKKTGEVFQWGDIGNGQRISSRLKNSRLVPHRVLFKSHGSIHPAAMKRVYAGGYSIFAVDANGVIWGWGPNNYNQIGIDSDPDTLWVCFPRPLESLMASPVVDLAAALHHTICVNEKGEVYTFGRGSSGRLGHGDEKDCKVPTLVASLSTLAGDKVIRVACGEAHTCCVTEKGELYTFGNGDLNQLGNGEEIDVPTPHHVQGQQLVVAKRKVLAAGCGSQHTVILTTVGDASAIQKTPAPAKALASEAVSTIEDADMKTVETKLDNSFSSTSSDIVPVLLFDSATTSPMSLPLPAVASAEDASPAVSVFHAVDVPVFVPAVSRVEPVSGPAAIEPAVSSNTVGPAVAALPAPAAVVVEAVVAVATVVETVVVSDGPEPMDEDEPLPEPDASDFAALGSGH
jgi:regulator of chromosome condensation